MIRRDFSTLPDTTRERYLQLIREGTPPAIAEALGIFGRARIDAEAVRQARDLLTRRPAIAQAQLELPKIEQRIAALDEKLDDLRRQRELLVVERDSTSNAASIGSWRQACISARSNPVVAAALREEFIRADFAVS